MSVSFYFYECFAIRDPYLNTGVYVDEVSFRKPLGNLRMWAGCQEIRRLELPDLLEGRGQETGFSLPTDSKGWVQGASG